MKNALVFTVLLSIGISGCDRSEPAPAGTQPDTAKTEAAPQAAKQPRDLTAAQVAQIAASGRTGLWADVPEVCTDRHKRRGAVTVAWNVQATGTKSVVLYLLGRNGNTRRVGRGNAIGGKPVGTWARPGSTFVLRAPDSQVDLGKLVIGGKQC